MGKCMECVNYGRCNIYIATPGKDYCSKFKPKGETMNEISFDQLKEKGCPAELRGFAMGRKDIVGKLTVKDLLSHLEENRERLESWGFSVYESILWLKENFEPKVTHKIGNRYRMKECTYLLCATGHNMVSLVNLEDGRYWECNFKVRDTDRITQYEFDKITNCIEGCEFKLISKGGEK